jgi:hypothetical protein
MHHKFLSLFGDAVEIDAAPYAPGGGLAGWGPVEGSV